MKYTLYDDITAAIYYVHSNGKTGDVNVGKLLNIGGRTRSALQ